MALKEMIVQLPCNIILFGKAGTGKTTFVKYELIPLLRPDYDNLVICSPPYNNYYSGENTVIVSENIAEYLHSVIMNQRMNRQNRVLIILDDWEESSEGVISLLNNLDTFRHFNISVIMTTQYLEGLPAKIRAKIGRAHV